MKRIVTNLSRPAIAVPVIALTLTTLMFSLAYELWTLFAIVDLLTAATLWVHSEFTRHENA